MLYAIDLFNSLWTHNSYCTHHQPSFWDYWWYFLSISSFWCMLPA